MVVPRVARVIGLLIVSIVAIGTTRWNLRQESPDEWRQRFKDAALQIPFEKDLPPQLDSAVPPGSRVPQELLSLRIAVAGARDTGRTPQIDLRVTSDSGYARLGIAPGVNYVWRDFVGGKMRELVIPADSKYKTHWLTVRSHMHPSPARVPRVVIGRDTSPKKRAESFYASTCTGPCSDNPLTWCTAQDTILSDATFKPPVDAMARYFARNHVAWGKR
jgi:hypothetical protein